MRLPVYTRQSLSLLGVVILLAGSVMTLLVWSNERYHEEVTQQLHKGLAQYVIEHAPNPIIDADGHVDKGVLKAIAMNTMMINPSVEVYLLDPHGTIMGHALPDLETELSDINIGPVERYLAQPVTGPVLGTNPRDPESLGIFSVAPLSKQEKGEDTLQGYLYIILASQASRSLAENVQDSYILKLALAAMLGVLLLFIAFMILGFRHFSNPIRVLAKQMRAYRQRDENEPDLTPMNELEELNVSFRYLRERVQAQFEQLAQNDVQRRELVANISHDLRTPLAVMQGYIETLLLKKDTLAQEEADQFLKVAHRQGVKLSTLISQLFELSKLDRGEMAAKVERFSISELLSDISMEYQDQTRHHGITLRLDVPQDPLFVQADIALIGRVIQNLLDNAMQHTDPDGTITIGLKPTDHRVIVSVSDSGKGISEDSLPFVFERHYQADDGAARKNAGAGLGLNIVKKILDLHHAAVRVRSELAKGTHIEFELAV